jgi:hypothetical protein
MEMVGELLNQKAADILIGDGSELKDFLNEGFEQVQHGVVQVNCFQQFIDQLGFNQLLKFL